MADLCDACSDWSTVGLQFGKMCRLISPTLYCVGDNIVDDTFFESATNVADVFLVSMNNVRDDLSLSASVNKR